MPGTCYHICLSIFATRMPLAHSGHKTEPLAPRLHMLGKLGSPLAVVHERRWRV